MTVYFEVQLASVQNELDYLLIDYQLNGNDSVQYMKDPINSLVHY